MRKICYFLMIAIMSLLAQVPVTAQKLSYVVLSKDKSFASQLTKQNAIYEIRYNYDIGGSVTIPSGCVLKFDGGSLSNGTLVGQNTNVQAPSYNIFGSSLKLDGTWVIDDIPIEWFGGVADFNKMTKIGTDNSPSLERALEFANKNYDLAVSLSGGMYYFATPIDVYGALHLKGQHYINRDLDNLTGTVLDSNSSIVVAPNITLFKLYGRNKKNGTTGYVHIGLDNLNFSSTAERNKPSSILLEDLAFAYPTRTSWIHQCEFSCFDKVLVVDATKSKKWSSIGLLSIDLSYFHFCKTAIYGKPNTGFRPSLCNLSITNSNFEYGEYAVNFKYLYGSCEIRNCIFEYLSKSSLTVGIHSNASLEISSCYFEDDPKEIRNAVTVESYKGVNPSNNQECAKVRFVNNRLPDYYTASFSYVHLMELDYLGNLESVAMSGCIIDKPLIDRIKLDWISDFCLINTRYIENNSKNENTPENTEVTLYNYWGRMYDNGTKAININNVYEKKDYSLKDNMYVAWFKGPGQLTFDTRNPAGDRKVFVTPTQIEGVVVLKTGVDFGSAGPIRLARYSASSTPVFCSQSCFFKNKSNMMLSDIPVLHKGSVYFNGDMPLWWNGKNWVDAMGAPVY